MSDWIKCTDRLPDDGQAVIYYFEFVGVNRGNYDKEDNCFHGKKGWLTDDVTHWMPDDGQALPDPPKEDKQ